jgi:hypothetical protein
VTTCLLCPSPVVADGLCVPCSARLWMSKLWTCAPQTATWFLASSKHTVRANPSHAWERVKASHEIGTPQAARAFLDKLEAARKARAAAPLCPRGCMSHEEDR